MTRPTGTAAAIGRSLRIYRGAGAPHAAMDALYRRFVRPGDLVFDVGAHVGDRVAAFRRLGARVVALEPQPGPARALRLLHGRDHDVILVAAAVSDAPGEVVFHLNSANPTVSSASADFVAGAAGAPGWEGQVWDRRITVPATNLDRLVAEHGRPAFVKIDVEGFEERVLAGLSAPLPALSFEFTTIARDVALRCLDRLAGLGPYGFDVALGESQRLTFGRFVGRAEMADFVMGLPVAANSGDVYAVLTTSADAPE
ncbi:FkbM family methyltransferase [Methylobacterium nonmethylotrophicum]|uniref:FkbM family methyltransferase n=1 Tax=Methylobacterium nonmethylotrophicum TaxID=1141884 RepID=A0A4Z0NMX3_9HYPH|nr:FkbM family methyltransferase [Methylobacterium nonmethylotrophicum]TGD97402.1 FkbM family methyltransferase [Methylobacterium nonmethylotrophicum]